MEDWSGEGNLSEFVEELTGKTQDERDVDALEQQLEDIKNASYREFQKSQATLKKERLRREIISKGRQPCR